jgi:hypothetical protein
VLAYDYYGGSVALRLSPGRPSQVLLDMDVVEDGLGVV